MGRKYIYIFGGCISGLGKEMVTVSIVKVFKEH